MTLSHKPKSNNFTLWVMNMNFHPSFLNNVKWLTNKISQIILLQLLMLLLLFIRENLWMTIAKQQLIDAPQLLPDSFIFQPIAICQTSLAVGPLLTDVYCMYCTIFPSGRLKHVVLTVPCANAPSVAKVHYKTTFQEFHSQQPNLIPLLHWQVYIFEILSWMGFLGPQVRKLAL